MGGWGQQRVWGPSAGRKQGAVLGGAVRRGGIGFRRSRDGKQVASHAVAMRCPGLTSGGGEQDRADSRQVESA
eukprot:791291-Rhodomonas_salina.5